MKLITKDAASYLGISMYYLRNMRQGLHPHDGPEFTWGRDSQNRPCCYYDKDALDAWKLCHAFRKRS